MKIRALRRRRFLAQVNSLISEPLEPRIFLSVSSTVLGDAETITGAVATYSLTSAPYNTGGATITETYTVTGVGPMTYNGQAAFESDDTTSYPGESPSVQKNYLAQTSQGLIDYAQVGDGYTNTFNPPSVIFPATAVAGVTYTLVSTGVTTGNTGNDPFTNTITATLSSDSTTPITVAAGTYDCYVVTGTTSDVDTNGGGLSIAYSQTIDFAPGVGVVQEQVVQTPAQAQLNSQVPLGGTGGFIKTYSLTSFKASADTLNFSQQPTNAPAGKTIQPSITIQLNNSMGALDTSATGSVSLDLQSASRLNTSTGTLSGTDTQPIVGGVATFSDLSVTANGTYTLQATDSNNDADITSKKFKIGPSTLALDINSKAPGGTKGVKTGDIILYSVLETPKQPVTSGVLVVTLPAGFTPTGISGGGTFSGNTITWTANTRVYDFDLVVPAATALGNISNITVSGDDNVVYADGSTDEATATNAVKLASSFEVDGTLHDVQYQYPNKLTISTRSGLGGVSVSLIDSTGAVISTYTTKPNGDYSLTASKAGTYEVEFSALASSYSSASNAVAGQRAYIAQSVTIPAGNTLPVDMGDIYLPKTFLDTAATTLNLLNNYNISSFQNLKTFNVDLFQFNTTGAESVLTALAGTADAPTAPMNVAALKIGSSTDPWVGAMRMIAGLQEVNARFVDTMQFADAAGKSLSIIASKNFAKGIGIFLGDRGFKNLFLKESIEITDIKFNVAARVFADSLATPLGYALDLLGASAESKNALVALYSSSVRYFTEAFTGKLIDDLTFDTVFNLFRLTIDATLLQGLTGATVRPDLAFPYNLIGVGLNVNLASAPGSTVNMQASINQCVSNYLAYNPGTDTQQVLTALDKFDVNQHNHFLQFSRATSIFSGLNGFLRAVTGVAGLQSTFFGPPTAVQVPAQHFLNYTNSAIETLTKNTPAALESDLLLAAFASAGVGTIAQITAATFIPNIVSNAVLFGPSSIVSVSPTAGSLTPTAAPKTPVAQALTVGRISTLTTVASPTDSASYIADLKQISTFVKSGNTAGIDLMDTQLSTDDTALFDNDLTLLDEQATAVLNQLSTNAARIVGKFDQDLGDATNFTLLAELQLGVWESDPATGNAKDVINQITTAITSVTALAKEAASVRSLISRFTIPASLVVTEQSVPVQVTPGTTVPFTFTVLNIGSQPTTAGEISFINTDGSLVPQASGTQVLASLAPGASATFTFQVLGVTPTDPDFGPAFEVTAVAGAVTDSVTDQVAVG